MNLKKTINDELKHILKYCNENKLSINFKKTNYMLIRSPKKKCNITIETCSIEQKKKIKYLGVFIDEHLQWDAQLKHVQKKIAKNTAKAFRVYSYTKTTLLRINISLLKLWYNELGYCLCI
jgi:hypothetical protein